MADTPYLVDSNILIRWLEPDHPDQIVVAGALDRLMRSNVALCYTPQNLGEFWNACTRPANRNGYGLSPEEANRRALGFETRLRRLQDGPPVYEEWRKLLVTHRVSGVQVHDARLVASTHVYGVKRILTFNTRDFERFRDIEAVLPKDVPALP